MEKDGLRDRGQLATPQARDAWDTSRQQLGLWPGNHGRRSSYTRGDHCHQECERNGLMSVMTGTAVTQSVGVGRKEQRLNLCPPRSESGVRGGPHCQDRGAGRAGELPGKPSAGRASRRRRTRPAGLRPRPVPGGREPGQGSTSQHHPCRPRGRSQ